MKISKTHLMITCMSALLIAACTKEQITGKNQPSEAKSIAVQSNCSSPYIITLEGVTPSNGNWVWTWSVQNPNPGNGSNGTFQNMSHWDILLGNCATMADVVSGSISTDSITWTDFVPTYQQDNAIWNTCNIATGDVLKFATGTSGSAKTFYRLTLSRNFDVDQNGLAYYKSGTNTGCGTTCFPGIGCPIVEQGCSYSQGYWFAAPKTVWPGSVTTGCQVYTQAEGKAIWNSSNSGGIGTAKKVFLQAASVQLSGSSVPSGSPVLQYIQIVDQWLCTLPKLTPQNVKNYNKAPGAANAAAAADSISNWIALHHCD